jgi:AcrR family transcriptional regulator
MQTCPVGPSRTDDAAPPGGGLERRRDARLNRARLLDAATIAVHRSGLLVPMAEVAAEAGVGVGTLYRHFATRDVLLAALTHRSFEQVLTNALAAERRSGTTRDRLNAFLETATRQRHELTLPLHGGPPVTDPATKAVRHEVHQTIQRILEDGIADGSIRDDATARDVVIFGAMLAQPLPALPNWSQTSRRLREVYLDGLAPNR